MQLLQIRLQDFYGHIHTQTILLNFMVEQKRTPDARTRHQQEGAERRGAGGIA